MLGVSSCGEALRGARGEGLAMDREEDVRAGSTYGLSPAVSPAAPRP